MVEPTNPYIELDGKKYFVVRSGRDEQGPFVFTRRQRPSQRGDSNVLQQAIWRVDGPHFNSHEHLLRGTGFLGVDYTEDVDTRWHDLAVLSPAVTETTLTASDSGDSIEATYDVAVATSANDTLAYWLRGTRTVKQDLSDWTIEETFQHGAGATRANSVIATTAKDGSQQLSITLTSTTYNVHTTIADAAGSDTVSANDEAKEFRIFGQGDDRVYGLGGSNERQIFGNILTGTTDMDASAWAEISSASGGLTGPQVRGAFFTGFAMDGAVPVLGTVVGPIAVNPRSGRFQPLISGLPADPDNCFPGDVRVSLDGTVWAVSRRWYEGRMVEIVTASGNKLSGTPNHPVLTNRGWVGLGDLQVGDHVLADNRRYGASGGIPNVKDVQPTLRELYDAAALNASVNRVRVGRPQFHGDGQDGEVEIVSIDPILWDWLQTCFSQPRCKLVLPAACLGQATGERLYQGRRVVPPAFHRSGLASEDSALFQDSRDWPDRNTISRSKILDAFTGHVSVTDNARRQLYSASAGPSTLSKADSFASASPMIAQRIQHTDLRNLQFTGELHSTFAGLVSSDQVVAVKGKSFAGHVYNLETAEGQYLANSTLVLNCRHMVRWFAPVYLSIPLKGGLRRQLNGDSQSWGVETFGHNQSPVQGYVTGQDGNTRWFLTANYNEVTDDTWLIMWRATRTDDVDQTHDMQPFVIRKFTDTKVRVVRWIDDLNNVLTNPHWIMGYGTSMARMLQGRTQYINSEYEDANYVFVTSGNWYGTDLRRFENMTLDFESMEIITANCNANQTITLGFSTNSGTSYTNLSGTYDSGVFTNGVVNTNGYHKVLFVDNSNVPLTTATGRTFKPRLAFATNTSAASPRVHSYLRLNFYARPNMVQEYQLTVKVEDQNMTPAEVESNLLGDESAGPVLLKDMRDSSFYVRVTGVNVHYDREHPNRLLADITAVQQETTS